MMKRTAVLTKLALRNLERHLRRTILTSIAMVLGGTMLMISLPLGDGTHEAWIESGVRMGAGHLTIEAPGFHTSRRIEDRLSSEARAAAESALESPANAALVRTVAPQVSVEGLASSPAGARPASIVGVDPESGAAFTVIDEKVIEGRYLKPDDERAAFVGKVLAEGLDLELGGRLVVTAQDATGEIAGQLLRVVGIFQSGVPEIDQSLVHIPIKTAGAWLSSGDDVTQIAILLDRSDEVPAVKRALERDLEKEIASDALVVMSWRESMHELDAAVKIDDFGNYLLHGILFTIIGLGVVNTVLMSVLHRRREFGVLGALGLTPRETGSLVLIEGAILAATSSAIGIGLGLFITWYFWRDGLDFSAMWSEDWTFAGVVMDPVIVPLIRTARIVQVAVFMLAVGILASLYPAVRAAHIDVTEAMKFER